MVHLSGLSLRGEANPGGVIAIEITGHRPGAKLFEELLIDGGFLMKWVAGYGESDQRVVPVPLRAVTSGCG